MHSPQGYCGCRVEVINPSFVWLGLQCNLLFLLFNKHLLEVCIPLLSGTALEPAILSIQLDWAHIFWETLKITISFCSIQYFGTSCYASCCGYMHVSDACLIGIGEHQVFFCSFSCALFINLCWHLEASFCLFLFQIHENSCWNSN